MKFINAINTLLSDACPSIKYRIRVEILNESHDSKTCKDLQKEISKDPLIQTALAWHNPDGSDIDQRRSWAMALRICYEKGLSFSNEILKGADFQFDYASCGQLLGRRIIEEPRKLFPFSVAINRNYFQLKEIENDKKIQLQSFELFKDVANIEDYDKLIAVSKTDNVFKKEFLWPDKYDAEVVGLGKAWRTKENETIMMNAIQKIIKLFPRPEDSTKGKYFRLPKKIWSNYSISYFRIPPTLPSNSYMWDRSWFKGFELLSRMPFLIKIPEIRNVVSQLAVTIEKNDGWFKHNVECRSWNFWSSYSGLSLEKSSFDSHPYVWESEKGRIYDTTFRCFLILKNFGFLQ